MAKGPYSSDAGVVDENVRRRKVVGHRCSEMSNAGRVCDVERGRPDAGVGSRHLVQRLLPAAGDDDVVAQRVEGLGQASANARPAARDQDRVTGGVHITLHTGRICWHFERSQCRTP